MLYACVTLRFLVEGTEGGCDLIAAYIRDWPDVRYRFTWAALRAWRRIATAWNGKYPPARPKEGVAAAKAGLDWILRHKINVVNFRHACEREKTEGLEAQFQEIYRYAFERGIWSYTFGAHGNLGHVKEGEATPEQKSCFHYGRHGMLSCWCWSADEAIFQGGAYEWYALQTLGAVQTMWDANTPGAVCLVEDKAKPFEHAAFGLSKELLLNGVRWLCGK